MKTEMESERDDRSSSGRLEETSKIAEVCRSGSGAEKMNVKDE